MSAALIQVEDALCRINSRQTLWVDSLSVHRGEHWCLFGGNGSGKSLLTALLLGKLVVGRAHVHYGDGFDPRSNVALVSFEEQQRLWAYDNRLDMSEYSDTAADQGTTVSALVLGRRSPDTAFHDLLEVLDLLTVRDQGIRFLSSGQVRRALIARALYAEPMLLVMDEPLESVDKDSRSRIQDAIRQWRSDDNASLLLSRRFESIMPGITHMAVLEALRVEEADAADIVMESAVFKHLHRRRPAVAGHLPVSPGLPQRMPVQSENVPLIELRSVNAGWQGRPILQDISWTMNAWHHTLVEGPNGCGKSTLLGLVNGENHLAYGQAVYLFGRRRGSGESVWEVKSAFGVVSNELHNRYVKGWRVLDVVVSGFFDSVGLYDDCGASQGQLAREWLELMGLEALSAVYYHELSFGQQRLVLLARAMIKHPALLILDEPCVGLDDYHRDMVLTIVDRIAEQADTRIIYVSHTDEETPVCINQYLHFLPQAQGPSKVLVSED